MQAIEKLSREEIIMISKNRILCVTIIMTALVSSLATAGGRPSDMSREWFGEFSGAWITPTGDAGDVLDDTWGISGGGLYWPSDWPAGIDINLGYASFDISNKALNAINDAIASDPSNSGSVDGGDVTIWQLTVDGIYSLGQSKTTGFYLAGGAGVYWVDAKLTETGLVYYPPFCDPYWYWCYPGGVGPGSIVKGSKSTTRLGWDAGVGYSFTPGQLSQFYIEAKYHAVYTGKTTEYIPVEFGVRW